MIHSSSVNSTNAHTTRRPTSLSQVTVCKGWLTPNPAIDRTAKWLSICPSPNFNQRPDKCHPRLIVIHNISLPPEQFGGGYIKDFFTNQLDVNHHPYFQTIATMQVSAHLLIQRNGQVIQFVSFDDRAWHAGQSCYLGHQDCNDYSIGIELEGSDNTPFAPLQYQRLAYLVMILNHAYPQTINHLAGHSDIAPMRKTDPGPYFNWLDFRRLIATYQKQ